MARRADERDGGNEAGVVPLKRISEIGAFDHVALPIENVEQMISFYSALGLLVR